MYSVEWCVYRHTAPDGRMYIGIAEEPHKRRWANGKGYKKNPEFWECINTVGWDNITHEIMASGIETRRTALKIESELIEKYDCLAPKGFNRRNDDGHSYLPRKKEIGKRFGHGIVLDYRPDEDGYKEYKLVCDCGNIFRCKARDISDETSCGCTVKEYESKTGRFE